MNINEIRKQINETDAQIVQLLVKRFGLSEEIAKYKIENSMQVFDKKREDEIIKRVSELSGDDLSPYICQVYSSILDLSKERQFDIISSTGDK